jgi:hypothetical protein
MIEAVEEEVSLNRLVSARLAMPPTIAAWASQRGRKVGMRKVSAHKTAAAKRRK